MSKNLFVWVGIIGLFALFIGFITSNTPAIKLLKRRRKPVQRIAYLAFLAASIHLFFFSHDLTYLVIFFVYLLLKIWERRPVKVKPVGEIKSEPVKSVPSLMAARVINHGMLTDHVLELVVEVHQELVVLPGQWALFSFTDKE